MTTCVVMLVVGELYLPTNKGDYWNFKATALLQTLPQHKKNI